MCVSIHLFVGALYVHPYVFLSTQVALLNFSKSYSDYANPAFVRVNDSSMTVAMTTPHDIILTDCQIQTDLVGMVGMHKILYTVKAFRIVYHSFVNNLEMVKSPAIQSIVLTSVAKYHTNH